VTQGQRQHPWGAALEEVGTGALRAQAVAPGVRGRVRPRMGAPHLEHADLAVGRCAVSLRRLQQSMHMRMHRSLLTTATRRGPVVTGRPSPLRAVGPSARAPGGAVLWGATPAAPCMEGQWALWLLSLREPAP
jgi:hypothetical protein